LRVGGRGVEGIEEARLRLTQSAVAFAMMCPTLLLRPLKIERVKKALQGVEVVD